MDEIQTLEIPDFPRYITDILYEYQQESNLCDCQIITNNGSIQAHSLILLITCPFFNGTITSSSHTQEIKFTVPFNIDDVGTIVRLLYTGKLMVSKDNITQIVDICNYLQLKEALSLCQKYIQDVPCKVEITANESIGESTVTGNNIRKLYFPQLESIHIVNSEASKGAESNDIPTFSTDFRTASERSNRIREMVSHELIRKTSDKHALIQAYTKHETNSHAEDDVQNFTATGIRGKSFSTVHKTGTNDGSMDMYITTESSSKLREEEGKGFSKSDSQQDKKQGNNLDVQICASNELGRESFEQTQLNINNEGTINSSEQDLQKRDSALEEPCDNDHSETNSYFDGAMQENTVVIKTETFDERDFTASNQVSTVDNPAAVWNYPYFTGYNPNIDHNPQSTGLNPQYTGINPQSTGYNPQYTENNPQFAGMNPQSIGINPQSTGNDPQFSWNDTGFINWKSQNPEPPKKKSKKVPSGRKGKNKDIKGDKTSNVDASSQKGCKKQRKKGNENNKKVQKEISNPNSGKKGRKRKINEDNVELNALPSGNEINEEENLQEMGSDSDIQNEETDQTKSSTIITDKDKQDVDKFTHIIFRCFICESLFETKDELIKHRDENHPGKELGRIQYVCNICGSKSTWDINHANHMYRLHGFAFDESKYTLYSCHYEGCDFNTLLAFRLKEHIRKKHGTESNFTCEICGKSFKVKESLTAHSVVHQEGPERIDFVCNVCGKSFIRKGSLTHHMEYVHLKKPYSYFCDHCEKGFQSKMLLASHMLTLHGENPKDYKLLDCDKCDYQCIYPSRMARHKELHQDMEVEFQECFNEDECTSDAGITHEEKEASSPKKNICQHCGKEFKYKQSLQRHIDGIHTDNFKFRCQECFKGFHKQRDLFEHMFKHAGTKPEECELCGSRFSSRRSKMAHLKSCSGSLPKEKDFECSICSSKFNSKKNRDEHMKCKHEPRRYKCKNCNKCYKYRSSLKYHKESEKCF